MGRRATDVNHLAFSVAKVLQKETGTLGQVPTVGCQPGGLRMHVWFKWIKLGLPATYCLKQEVVLLYQDLELRAKRSLSRLASRDFVMSGKFSPLPATWKHRFAWRRPKKGVQVPQSFYKSTNNV